MCWHLDDCVTGITQRGVKCFRSIPYKEHPDPQVQLRGIAQPPEALPHEAEIFVASISRILRKASCEEPPKNANPIQSYESERNGDVIIACISGVSGRADSDSAKYTQQRQFVGR
jgi:hypothetical protein